MSEGKTCLLVELAYWQVGISALTGQEEVQLEKYYLAIDIGASSGRHILGSIKEGQIHLEEIYRFNNSMQKMNGMLCWDTRQIFQHILTGMKRCRELGKIPISVGIDTWGVDFVLVDGGGNILGEAVGYRDSRTDDMDIAVNKYISIDELYRRTGIPKQMYNTIYQLMAVKETNPKYLEQAEAMLMTPNYYNYLLTGIMKQEYTIATTSQLVQVKTKDWDYELMDRLGYPRHIFKPIEKPGAFVGNLTPKVQDTIGYDCQVIMVASHDTASAVMAVPSIMEDTLYISSGTWSLMGIELTEPNNSIESNRAGFSNEGGYDDRYRYLKNIMGLWMIQSVKKEVGGQYSYEEICSMAKKEDIVSLVDCNDSSFMSPDSMVEAVKTFCKASNQQVPETLGEIAAVIYNSLAKCYGDTLREIEALTGKSYDTIHIIGGGSNADYLNMLTGKYTGCKVLAGPGEATAIGNLMAQMIHSHEITSLEEGRRLVKKSLL